MLAFFIELVIEPKKLIVSKLVLTKHIFNSMKYGINLWDIIKKSVKDIQTELESKKKSHEFGFAVWGFPMDSI